MSTTTIALGRKNRPQTTIVPQGLGRALLAVVAVLALATVALTLVPGLALAIGLAVYAALLVGVVASPVALVLLVAETL
ncbi:hypothetical protein [Haloarchaeobius litoreus]|uniref:Uncharacterized protein n=1 Tax=Haloarchaeobius litoreus TaxID=755306 RepID=A0ABD6DLH9_9EURY|nr:hypothetical protein [Haloarchaeobius litoreus]